MQPERQGDFTLIDRWLEPTTSMRLRGAQRHVSPTDRDVQWLQEHCTYLK